MKILKNIIWLAKNKEKIEKMLENKPETPKKGKKVAFGVLTQAQQDYVNKIIDVEK